MALGHPWDPPPQRSILLHEPFHLLILSDSEPPAGPPWTAHVASFWLPLEPKSVLHSLLLLPGVPMWTLVNPLWLPQGSGSSLECPCALFVAPSGVKIRSKWQLGPTLGTRIELIRR